jgi:predicted SprT family Zn-dependent metalloprotease
VHVASNDTFGKIEFDTTPFAPLVVHETKPNPTQVTYIGFAEAYDWFNSRLFHGALPRPLITMQRQRGSYGYFASDRFGTRDRSEIVGEIALNPIHFESRTVEDSLSTLVHEMVHLWQQYFGNSSRSGYHNREWAQKMKAVGLQPDNGKGGGTGQRVDHHIVPGGPFSVACAELLSRGTEIRYVDLWRQRPGAVRRTRSKYTCPDCGLNAWAKPQARLDCTDCGTHMVESGGQ